MKILTVRQPWAWLIIHGGKNTENRTWRTSYRGPLLIQASSRSPQCDADSAQLRMAGVELPARFSSAGIIGVVDLLDCVSHHDSAWFTGPIGWVLANPRPLPFIGVKGAQTLFSPPPELAERLRGML